MERKSSKEYPVVFLVESEKFKFAFEDFIFVVGSAANSVGPNAKYSGASAFCFFLSTTMVFAAFQTHFPRKNTSMFMSIGVLSREKKTWYSELLQILSVCVA